MPHAAQSELRIAMRLSSGRDRREHVNMKMPPAEHFHASLCPRQSNGHESQ